MVEYSKKYVWIMVHGGVIGFSVSEIQDFNQLYRTEAEPFGIDYWDYFSQYFSSQLNGKTALCVSTLWTSPETLSKLG